MAGALLHKLVLQALRLDQVLDIVLVGRGNSVLDNVLVALTLVLVENVIYIPLIVVGAILIKLATIYRSLQR